jgi:hypothetical protein
MTMRIRAAMVLLVGLACACVAWAQDAAQQADGMQADPEVWGVYATLAGQERQQEGETRTYVMRWRWLEPGAQLREEYIVPSSGKLAHYNTITPGPRPGTLHLKASYMGGKEWNGTLDADGTVHWVGKGLFKLRYAVGPGPDGALLYGMEGQAPMRYVRVDGGADAAPAGAATAAQSQSAAELEAMAAQLQARALEMRQAEAAKAEQTAQAAEEAARVAAQAAAQARAAAEQAAMQANGGTADAASAQASAAMPAAATATAQASAEASSAIAASMSAGQAVAAPVAPAPAAAPASPTDGFTPGTYMLDGGSYVIEVQRDGDGLLVVEPNKRSPYAWQGGRDFHFYNPNTDTTYGIRVVDARTIEAFKPFVDGNVPSRLTLLSAAATGSPQEALGDPAFEAIAEKYAAMIETDPANVQSWTACAGAALKYSMATREEADAYARQMIQMLRLMDAQSTPCEDALPSRLW